MRMGCLVSLDRLSLPLGAGSTQKPMLLTVLRSQIPPQASTWKPKTVNNKNPWITAISEKMWLCNKGWAPDSWEAIWFTETAHSWGRLISHVLNKHFLIGCFPQPQPCPPLPPQLLCINININVLSWAGAASEGVGWVAEPGHEDQAGKHHPLWVMLLLPLGCFRKSVVLQEGELLYNYFLWAVGQLACPSGHGWVIMGPH